MSNDAKPRLSVLMGVRYRRSDPQFLRRAVQSVLDQTCAELELLICDGGSSPDACRLLDSFAAADSRVRLLRDAHLPADLAHKLNACLNASGAWIARMDAMIFPTPSGSRGSSHI